MSIDSACAGIADIQEAAFRVESSISVREQYKTKLRALVDALLPSTSPSSLTTVHPQSNRRPNESSASKATTNASKKKQTRDAVADRLQMRATMPTGKELQVVGDWLLLLRAASVNVVESIDHWRSVVHQNRPLPYEIDHANYLLQMAHDVNFLDRCDDLVAWLGFRLVRNPFIVTGGLDANSKNNATLSISSCGLGGGQKEKSRQLAYPSPPSGLVKPLVGITPEDDVVDGARIATAHTVLNDEEALYGRAKTSQLLQAHFAKPVAVSILCVDEYQDDDNSHQNGRTKSTVFDEIAAVTKTLRGIEHHLLYMQREYVRTTNLQKLIEDQIRSTTSHREHDLVSDHRVWSFRDKCRESTLRSSRTAQEDLKDRIQSLEIAITTTQTIVSKRQQQLNQLVAQKDRTRQQRHEKKRRVEAEEIARRTGTIRRKTLERNCGFKAERTKTKPRSHMDQTKALPDPLVYDKQETADIPLVDGITTSLGASASPTDRRVELDQIRATNLERRQQLRTHHEQVLSDELKAMNHRRNEKAQMFLEDKLSAMVESRSRLLIYEKQRKDRAKKLMATPICSIVQAIGGGGGGNNDKKFVISVYDHHAQGYAPDGLRFVAYDPSTSRSLSLLMSTREFNSLGYGRTLEGLGAFCQWLCTTYDKRKRQFKLVWSGAPCPPPLRLREYDNALVCVHKEGIRFRDLPSGASFVVAAVYIRTNDPSKLRFVMSCVHDGDTIIESAVAASHLLPTKSILLRSEFEGGLSYASWLHTSDDENHGDLDAGWDNSTSGTRVYSGEMAGVDAKRPTRVHIYDASLTEYELHIDTSPIGEPEAHKPIVLLKHDVNPYRVRLPGSAFGDLVSCIKLERRHDGTNGSEATVVRAVLLPSWRAFLARYVRALRMAKFGCKIDGVFFLIVVTLVQQKTEFRAHLLFELAPVGDTGARHSLRISFSQYLRCRDVNWNITQSGTMFQDERTQSCHRCHDNRSLATAVPVANSFDTSSGDHHPESEWHTPCRSCDEVQTSRLVILRTLLDTGALTAEADLNTLYYATCMVCGAVPPPIAIVIPTRGNVTSADEEDGLVALLHHYFTCVDGVADCFEAHATAIRNTLEHSRIFVIRMATPTIGTYLNAVSAADQVREILYLDQRTELSVTITVIYRQLDIFHLDVDKSVAEVASSSQQVLEQALRDTATAICHVGGTEPTVDDATDDDQPGIADFEGYLVSEALLVEATQVILRPDLEWRAPGETVGASSWSVACEFLRNPQQLSRDLHDRQNNIVAMNPHARQILEAYAAHPKWPVRPEDVRVPFQALLSCVLHIVYVQHLLTDSGSLFLADCHNANDHDTLGTDGGGIYDIENGAKVIVTRRQ